jgi:hypothetical protein
MKTHLILTAACMAALPAIAGTTVPALDQPQLTVTTDTGWRVGTSIYGWTTRLDGDMTIHGTKVPVHVPFTKLFENLKFTFMGNVEVGKDKWSFMSDLFYARLEPSTSNKIADFDSRIQQFIGDFAVFYHIIDTPAARLDAYAGARVNWMKTEVDVTGKGPFGKSYSDSGEQTWVDPIIGVRCQRDLTDKFFVRALADIGGFGVSSDLTWQAMVALGYRVSEHSSLGLGYRAIGVDYTHNNLTYDVTSHGLLLGFEYRF